MHCEIKNGETLICLMKSCWMILVSICHPYHKARVIWVCQTGLCYRWACHKFTGFLTWKIIKLFFSPPLQPILMLFCLLRKGAEKLPEPPRASNDSNQCWTIPELIANLQPVFFWVVWAVGFLAHPLLLAQDFGVLGRSLCSHHKIPDFIKVVQPHHNAYDYRDGDWWFFFWAAEQYPALFSLFFPPIVLLFLYLFLFSNFFLCFVTGAYLLLMVVNACC